MASRQEEKEQRRTERLEAERRAADAEQRRRRLMLIGGAVAAVVAAVVVIVVIAGSGGDGGSKSAASTVAPDTAASTLPGAQTGPPPWNAGTDQLQERLQALNLPALPAEGTVVHIHQHLDLYVDGKHVTVPALIGIGQTFISPLHTHDTSGVLHVESDKQRSFTLGQVFGVWGVPLSANQIGGLQAGGAKQLRAWVNGNPFAGDPSTIGLASHEEIVLAYGTAAQTPKPVPSRFAFPPGV
jgi:hypothetical protein